MISLNVKDSCLNFKKLQCAVVLGSLLEFADLSVWLILCQCVSYHRCLNFKLFCNVGYEVTDEEHQEIKRYVETIKPEGNLDAAGIA